MRLPPTVSVPVVEVPTSVLFPDGTTFYVANISSVQASAANVILGIGGAPNAYTFAAINSLSASRIAAQINDAKSGITNGGIVLVDSGLPTFSSITPTTAFAGGGGTFAIAGTAFLTAGFDLWKADDGAGNVFVTGLGIPPDSDVLFTLVFDSTSLAAPAVYTVYYSIDTGSSWVSTALTITAS